ncbi:uncharacterized protein LOC130694992 isoform X2 [Daphnia carinata]|uniref:uncharacterized protein LOC130694992 isoform X2 n=1 Tax=Daphnia carinata TaxID=120202 RepID=UPI002580AAE1|nr:uncharacterized protein LOC130694992 isoform X2 [Daphnia carinata]
MNNNVMNKEAIQLLNAASSDSDSASDLQFSLAPQPTVQVRRKIRTKRKQRRGDTGNGSQSPALSQLSCSCSNVLKIACISFAVGGTLVLGWIVMLLHTEVQQLSEKLASVPASYDDETILGLKRTIKELTLNQSYHFYVLQNYSRGLEDFRQQMTSMTTDVSNIKDSLKEAPQMLNIGKELDSLKSSLVTYGATISDLKLGLAELKESPTAASLLETFNSTLQGRLDTITEDLHHHHGMITSLQNTTERLSSQIPAANVPQRMDAVQNALVKLEAQQINTTLTLSYAMELIQQITSGSLGRAN